MGHLQAGLNIGDSSGCQHSHQQGCNDLMAHSHQGNSELQPQGCHPKGDLSRHQGQGREA
jgi:hypothetical protein